LPRLTCVAESENMGTWFGVRKHPTLHMWYAGYLQHGYTFRFRIREISEFLDDTVDLATYDSFGQLVVCSEGRRHGL